MAQIKKLTEGRYLIRASCGTGKNRVYDNVTFEGTLREARAEARDMEILLHGGSSRLGGLTFKKCVKLWLASIENKVAPRTHDGYEGSIRRYATPVLGDIRLRRIETADVQAVYDGLKLSATTVRNLHAGLNAFFAWAARCHAVKENPCRDTNRPIKTRSRHITVLDDAEARRFVEVCSQKQNGVIFELALETGMSPEEYLALRWSDLSGTQVSVAQAIQFNRSGGGYYFKDVKAKHRRRRVPISDALRSRLIAHRIQQNEHRLAMKGTWFNHDLIFPNEIGRPYSISNLTRRYLKPVLDACSFGKHVTLYSLRHSCATLLLMHGTNPKVVADRLGHSSVVMTLDTYSHVLPHIQEDATITLDAILRQA